MSVWSSGRQTSLGLSVLGIGSSIAFLFFYSPKPKISSPFDARSLDIYPDLGLPSSDIASHPAKSSRSHATRWQITPPQSHSTVAEPGHMVSLNSSNAAKSLDDLLANPPTPDSLPKAYPQSHRQLPPPSPARQIGGQSPSIQEMIPLPTSPSLNPNSNSRFGAGAYRPSSTTPTSNSFATTPTTTLPILPTTLSTNNIQQAPLPHTGLPLPATSSFASSTPASPLPNHPPQFLPTSSPNAPSNNAVTSQSLSTPNLTSIPQPTPNDVFSRYESQREPKFIRQPRAFR